MAAPPPCGNACPLGAASCRTQDTREREGVLGNEKTNVRLCLYQTNQYCLLQAGDHCLFLMDAQQLLGVPLIKSEALCFSSFSSPPPPPPTQKQKRVGEGIHGLLVGTRLPTRSILSFPCAPRRATACKRELQAAAKRHHSLDRGRRSVYFRGDLQDAS